MNLTALPVTARGPFETLMTVVLVAAGLAAVAASLWCLWDVVGTVWGRLEVQLLAEAQGWQ